jgi:hypothetical protein
VRKHIRAIWRNAGHPLRKLWHWATEPERAIRRAKRWEALRRWAGAHKHQATNAKDKATWAERRGVYAKREKRARKRAEHKPTPAATGCGSAGPSEWSGGASICEREVVPVASRYGAPITSRKRTTTLGNPSSDHYVGNTTAYAVDIGTFNGAPIAHAIAKALGISGYSTGNYNGYYIQRCSKTFRVQILWAVSGHYDHVHCGVRLA